MAKLMPEEIQIRTPYDLIGGAEIVRQVVDRFYDLMEEDAAYAELRAMHASDLAPMRQSLAGFLTAWLGGPRAWFEARPGVCMMSMHRRMTIPEAAASQWADAMHRAVTEFVSDRSVAEKMAQALASLAHAMANVPAL